MLFHLIQFRSAVKGEKDECVYLICLACGVVVCAWIGQTMTVKKTKHRERKSLMEKNVYKLDTNGNLSFVSRIAPHRTVCLCWCVHLFCCVHEFYLIWNAWTLLRCYFDGFGVFQIRYGISDWTVGWCVCLFANWCLRKLFLSLGRFSFVLSFVRWPLPLLLLQLLVLLLRARLLCPSYTVALLSYLCVRLFLVPLPYSLFTPFAYSLGVALQRIK